MKFMKNKKYIKQIVYKLVYKDIPSLIIGNV